MNDRMHPQDNSYQQDNFWDAFSELPFDVNAPITASAYSQSAWSLMPPTFNSDPEALNDGFYSTLISFTDQDSSLALPNSEFGDMSGLASHSPIELVSPAATVSTPGMSGSSVQDDPKRLSPASASTSRVMTREDLQRSPRLHEAIQTVSEYRKSRRRAQNRSAQQAFKERKKRREKELVAQIDTAERNYKRLEVQNKQLREDLEERKKHRPSSMVSSTSDGSSVVMLPDLQRKRNP